MSRFPRKIVISNKGIFIDDVEVTGVVGAEIKNINPGHAGLMEVALHIQVREVDVQYRQYGASGDELREKR